jgi:DNA-binding beta-propeller fold protein YncE
MGEGRLLVIDLAPEPHFVARLPHYPSVTGVLAVPELGKVYASVPGAGLAVGAEIAMARLRLGRGSGALVVDDMASLAERARLPAGVFPDGIAFDPREGRVFVSDEMGDGITVVDGATDSVLARIATPGEVGNVQYDPLTARVYAPIQTEDALAVVDPVAMRLDGLHPLPGGHHPHGLRIARDVPVAYVACDGDDRLLVLDLRTFRVLTTLPLGPDPDVLADDPVLHRLYVAGESGTLAVFDVTAPAAPVPLGQVEAGPDAHSLAVDPTTHRLYIPIANLDGRSVLRVLEPRSGGAG